MDDLESCFWVALWSAIFNKQHEKSLTLQELNIRDKLANSMKVDAAMGAVRLLPREHSDVMKRFQPVLGAWWGKLLKMWLAWREVEVNCPEDAGEKYYLPRFHVSALQGVVDILEVVSDSEHWNGDLNWESWTPPSPPAVPH